MATEELLGAEFKKLQPKLRMIAKASETVNAVRSDYTSSVRVAAQSADDLVPDTLPSFRSSKNKTTRGLSAPKLDKTSDEIEVSVFVTQFGSDASAWQDAETNLGVKVDCTSVGKQIATSTVKLSELGNLAEQAQIASIELGEALKAPDAKQSRDQSTATKPPKSRNQPGRDSGGRDVFVGIIDVQGFDFSHSDFMRDGKTRFHAIWDQGGNTRPPPAGFDYGAEVTQEHMQAAVDASGNEEINIPAWALEPQSQMVPGSHATHVASIAAGNRGVARNAILAGVLIALPNEEAADRRRSFYDSSRVAHAVSYLLDLAERYRIDNELAELPVSINISLGTNGGAHDASNAVSRWIDSALSVPGRNVCVAAGNAGQEKSTSSDDFGFVTGRIHTSGKIEARGLDEDIEWIVVGNGIDDVSENELELWYSASDRFEVSLTPPGGLPTIGPIKPGEYVQNKKLRDGSFVSIYNELYHPANGDNYIAIYLSPFLKENPVIGVRPGVWKVRLHGVEVRDGRYHGWIERDDPRPHGVLDGTEIWNFPSFFSQRSNVDKSSVSSLACGARVISVANLDERAERINISSSQGPTRDGRNKPDCCAPGTDVVAANGFAGEGDSEWIAMTGTSMASPHVTGVVALMLEVAPHLTAAQIRGILQRTAQPLPGATYSWVDDAGYGRVDAQKCVAEARSLAARKRLNG